MSVWKDDLVNEDVEHISPKTREKAITLAENAQAVGIKPGTIRFNNKDDFMCFWFSNGLKIVIVFCTPYCYMVEIHSTKDGENEPQYVLPKNIRHFLCWLKKENMVSFDEYYKELAELIDMGDEEINDIISRYKDEEDEDSQGLQE